MASTSTSFSLPKVMKDEIDVLVESGEYSSRSDVMRDAFREFLRNNPEKRTRAAVELYREEKVSLMRAAEIAEIDLEGFKDELEKREVSIKTASGDSEELERVEERL
jgi:Arc/MetJ-type ribon-helix-helix transcriptional regulator